MAWQLAVSTYSLARWRKEQGKTLEASLAAIAESGVPAVEFAGLDEKAQANPVRRARALRKRCEKLGLGIPSYCVGANLLTEAAEQKATVERLKREVEVGAALGVRSLRHDVSLGPPAGAGMTYGAFLKAVVPAIREVAEYGAARGVQTSLENHGFYLQTAERVEKLIQAVGHPNFALTLDMGNFLCLNQDPVEAVRRLAKYAVMVHVKDFHVRAKKSMPPKGWFATPTAVALRGAIAGHGVIDIPAQLRLLKKSGYTGYLSLEFEGMEEPVQAVRLGLDYLRRELAKL